MGHTNRHFKYLTHCLALRIRPAKSQGRHKSGTDITITMVLSVGVSETKMKHPSSCGVATLYSCVCVCVCVSRQSGEGGASRGESWDRRRGFLNSFTKFIPDPLFPSLLSCSVHSFVEWIDCCLLCVCIKPLHDNIKYITLPPPPR